MGRLIKRQFLDFKAPSTTRSHLKTLVKKNKKLKTKKKHWKESKITEIKRALQSTKENSGKAGKAEWNTV